jgi:hypothetical protein
VAIQGWDLVVEGAENLPLIYRQDIPLTNEFDGFNCKLQPQDAGVAAREKSLFHLFGFLRDAQYHKGDRF